MMNPTGIMLSERNQAQKYIWIVLLNEVQQQTHLWHTQQKTSTMVEVKMVPTTHRYKEQTCSYQGERV